MMKLFVVLVMTYALSHSQLVNGQWPWCANLPPLSAIETDLRVAVNSSDQAGSTFILGELFYNCITYGSADGSTFRETTITAVYEVDNGTSMGQVLYACVDMNGVMAWVSDSNNVMLKTGLQENGTEKCMNCRELSPTTCTGQCS